MTTSVAVVTSTIGRDTLEETIHSVITQTYPAKHYVFVHGEEFKDKAKAILDNYPDVTAIYLPHNNGANGFGMAPVYAMAPYVIKEDVICYLDDDNFYEAHHVESCVYMIEQAQVDWVYALRNIVDADGKFICQDNCESLGLIKNSSGFNVVDNSCFVVRRELARYCASAWYNPVISDRKFLEALFNSEARCGCTGMFTVNYRMSKDGSGVMPVEAFIQQNQTQVAQYGTEFPWLKPQIFQPQRNPND